MMAGAVDTPKTILEAPTPDAPSPALYLAGGVIALCGIFAADAALTQPDPGWVGRTMLLSALGFVFSYGSRLLGIRPAAVYLGFGAVVLLLLAGVAAGQVAPEQFLPLGADNPILRLLAGLVWGGTVWAWALRTDAAVMFVTVPVMAVLGLSASTDLNNPVLACFGVFILTVIFLLIHQNFLQNRLRAAAEARARVPARLLLAQFVQAGLCGLGVLLAGLVVIIPAQAAFSHLSLTQAIRRLTAGKHTPAIAGGATRFSDGDSLDIGTGAAWSSSAEIVMHVTPSDGQEHYWRGRTYDVYNGAGWTSGLENVKDAARDGGPTPDGEQKTYFLLPGQMQGNEDGPTAPPLTATYRVFGDTSQFYYPASPRSVVIPADAAEPGDGVRVCKDGWLTLASGYSVRFPYQTVSIPPPDPALPDVQARLRSAGEDYPAEVRVRYLDLKADGLMQPEDADFFRRSVAEATHLLPPDRRDPLDDALALRDWVSRRCTYSLAPPPIPADADHVRYFLNDGRRGYCDMFASSLAVLCRADGIPARLATGFAPGDPDGASGFNLRSEDKHAWTEVYFPRTGWVALDATAGAATDGTVPRPAGARRADLLTALRRFGAGLGARWGLVAPLLAAVALLVGFVLKTEVYDRWRAKRPRTVRAASAYVPVPSSGLGRRYARLLRALSRLGLDRHPSETPDEHSARVLPLLPALESECGVSLSRPLVSGLTAAVALACYARPGADSDPAKWDDALAHFESASWRAYWRHLLRRVAKRGAFKRSLGARTEVG